MRLARKLIMYITIIGRVHTLLLFKNEKNVQCAVCTVHTMLSDVLSDDSNIVFFFKPKDN